jgi:hypothetical protein|nr:MAG TPA: hypothetical protein [Caudoviricetes sp.]
MVFNIGDIIRCSTNKYEITSYKRPCEVVNILNKEFIDVRCLDGDGSLFEVYTELFELVPKHEILHKDMYVEDEHGRKYKFIKYEVKGIRVENILEYTLRYDNIVYKKQFVV